MNYILSRFATWYYDVGNILKSFERTQRRLSDAAAHHNEQVGVHAMAIEDHARERAKHVEQAARALMVRDKITALIS